MGDMHEGYVSKADLNSAIASWLQRDKYLHPYSKHKSIPISELRDIIETLRPSAVVPNWTDKWRVYTEDEEGNPLSWICPNCNEVVETKYNCCPECGIYLGTDGRKR